MIKQTCLYFILSPSKSPLRKPAQQPILQERVFINHALSPAVNRRERVDHLEKSA